MNIKKHIGKNLIKPSEFGKRKNVTSTAVWFAIHADRIPVTQVGKNQDVYIDWAASKDFEFDSNKKNNTKK